jgi:hypothetical protein
MSGLKKCSGTNSCGLKKELNNDNFVWRNDSNKWRPQCRDCVNENDKKRGKIYRELHSEVAQKYRDNHKGETRQYKDSHKNEIKEYNKEYKNSHAEYYKEYQKKYTKERRKNDLWFRTRHDISIAVNRAIKLNRQYKKGSITDYLNIGKMIECLKSKYEWWMTDKNQGVYNPKTWDDNDPSTWTWQIDHIIPQSDLPYTEMSHDPESNFQKCWALDNIRPLSAKINILDGVTRARHKKR